jgi:lipopolysaccharide assembly outer membrane protein LptD (OstA)
VSTALFKMNRRSLFLLSLALPAIPVAVLAQNVLAQNAAPAAKKSVPSANTVGNVVIRNSPAGTAIYDDARGIAKLTKDVSIVQTGQDFILKAQEATYNRPKNQAYARGNLNIDTRDSTITGESTFADFNEKTMTVNNNVVVSSHGKGDGIAGNATGFRSEVRRKPIKITCTTAEWNYETRQAVLSGNIRIYQEDNTGTCDSIFYDEAQNIVQLRGKARFGNTKKQTFLGEDLYIYVDTGKVQSKMPILLQFPSNDPVVQSTPRATKRPVTLPPPSEITEDDLKLFDRTPAPKPTITPSPSGNTEDEGDIGDEAP